MQNSLHITPRTDKINIPLTGMYVMCMCSKEEELDRQKHMAYYGFDWDVRQ